jgi:cell division protein FtsL
MVARCQTWYRRFGGVWGLGSAIVVVSLVVLWHHSRMIRIGYETERLEADRGRLERIHRQLVLERESLASLDRVEHLAAGLGLVHLASRDVVVVRIDPSPAERDQTFAVALGRGMLPAEAHAAP